MKWGPWRSVRLLQLQRQVYSIRKPAGQNGRDLLTGLLGNFDACLVHDRQTFACVVVRKSLFPSHRLGIQLSALIASIGKDMGRASLRGPCDQIVESR